jgi:phytoene synthase
MADTVLRDPEMALSLAYVPAARRQAIRVLWLLDERLGVIVAGPNPPIAAIKLAWWREALERLDTAPPPAEPLLREIADELLPTGVRGAELAAIAGGWDVLLEGDDEDEAAMLMRHAQGRGAGLFTIAARLLGGQPNIDVTVAGEMWALASIGPPRRVAAMALLGGYPRQRRRWPRRLRALGMLAALARDGTLSTTAERGSPRRVARALWHGLSGY